MKMLISRRAVIVSPVAWGFVSFSKRALAADELNFNELYTTGVELTPKAKSLAGKEVTMSGFMAPPLKAEADFFVLTRVPMAVCPFCDSQMDWPDDIVLVELDDIVSFTPFNRRISVTGRLEVGFVKDGETGFVSFVRLVSASYGQV
jgi:uncharacterized membrane protein YcgQ (UPF0703/DUF1980 family)